VATTLRKVMLLRSRSLFDLACRNIPLISGRECFNIVALWHASSLPTQRSGGHPPWATERSRFQVANRWISGGRSDVNSANTGRPVAISP
jgi:hypothetical protein